MFGDPLHWDTGKVSSGEGITQAPGISQELAEPCWGLGATTGSSFQLLS